MRLHCHTFLEGVIYARLDKPTLNVKFLKFLKHNHHIGPLGLRMWLNPGRAA